MATATRRTTISGALKLAKRTSTLTSCEFWRMTTRTRTTTVPRIQARQLTGFCCCGGTASSYGGQRLGQLAARADAELAVGVAEVDLDRLRGDEQLLGDVAVGAAVGGEAGDAPLAGGQRLDAG